MYQVSETHGKVDKNNLIHQRPKGTRHMKQAEFLRLYDFDSKLGYIKREVPIPAPERQSAGDCGICRKPVLVAPGQMIKGFRQPDGSIIPSHKACRKQRGL